MNKYANFSSTGARELDFGSLNGRLVGESNIVDFVRYFIHETGGFASTHSHLTESIRSNITCSFYLTIPIRSYDNYPYRLCKTFICLSTQTRSSIHGYNYF